MDHKNTLQDMIWDMMIFIIILGILMIGIGVYFFIITKDLYPMWERIMLAFAFIAPAIINSRIIIRTYKGKDMF